jgi:hypothetical protein
MKLYPDHVKSVPELDATNWLSRNGYNVDIQDTRIVQSESDPEKAYVVQKVETTKVPFERADCVADAISIILCSCDSCRYQSFDSVDVEQSLSGFETCKHSRVYREENARQDESQAQLFDV